MLNDTDQIDVKEEAKAAFKASFINKLEAKHSKGIEEASVGDLYSTLSSVMCDYLSPGWMQTNKEYTDKNKKQVYYFSMEFLMGKLLEMNLINSGLWDVCNEVFEDLGVDLKDLEQCEPDAGLGNGGLGRLAACFLDSMAALKLPGHGCGIRYQYGLFEQKIVNNHQVELPDNWLKDGYAWEFRRGDKAVEVKFGGSVRTDTVNGKFRVLHEGYEAVSAVPYDIPIAGYENNTVNTLRLWNAEPIGGEFDLPSFNRGDYLKAVEYRHSVDRISKILYPEDNFYEGRLLRLKQQYFFVSAGLQSILRRFKKKRRSVRDLDDYVAIHINDTHPAVAVPELMRILMDEEGLNWEDAWKITTNTISYTNHTIMPEALEKWPVEMFRTLLPRMYMIVEEINARFCQTLGDKYPGQWERIREMSIIEEGNVHMARLAVVGSYSVNGVAAIHTDILRKHVMRYFNENEPQKFNNKTNGITHRRWLLKANPLLSKLITETIGDSWIHHTQDLIRLLKYADDKTLHEKFFQVKRNNKIILANYIKNKYDIDINVDSIFDVQVKRIHSYKRQILNVLHIMDMYNRLRDNPDLDITPRTFIFAGKAAPGYQIAKETIQLINVIAGVINSDKTIQNKLKVVFLENYSVSLGEIIFPASDVSEQISTASKEASGTGNMKFMMNGAVTIGTLDGANVEISEAVGKSNIFIFGLTADQVINYYIHGGYNVWDIYNKDIRVKTVLDQLVNGFLPVDKGDFRMLNDSLLWENDEFFVMKDFAAYADAQALLEERYKDRSAWLKMSISNIAQAGIFSSDRSISEYAIGIWNIKPVEVPR